MPDLRTWYLRADQSQTAVIVGVNHSNSLAGVRMIEFECGDGSRGSMDRVTFIEHYTAFPANGADDAEGT